MSFETAERSAVTAGKLTRAMQIALQPGLNSVTLTVEDEAGKASEDNVAVTYTPPDADTDVIADAWEMQFFGNLPRPARARMRDRVASPTS